MNQKLYQYILKFKLKFKIVVADGTSDGERRTCGAPYRQYYIGNEPYIVQFHTFITANNWLKKIFTKKKISRQARAELGQAQPQLC